MAMFTINFDDYGYTEGIEEMEDTEETRRYRDVGGLVFDTREEAEEAAETLDHNNRFQHS